VSEGLFILAAGALLAGTIGAAVFADALRVPALVLFLALGMAAGSDGAGLIGFDDYEVARRIGTLALSLILFEGGLSMTFSDLRPVLRPAFSLAVVGTTVTALLIGVAAAALLGISPITGLLLGSVLASTDGAAVFSMLRGSRLNLRLVRTLEGEAGLNDPVAILLVIGFINWIQQPGYGLGEMLGLFLSQLTIGAAAGLLAGSVGAAVLRRVTLPSTALYPVATVAVGAIAYGLADASSGSGFLAVYLAGLSLISSHPPAQMTLAIFHRGAAWLAQAALFLTLGLLVFPAQLGSALIPGTLLAAFAMVVARPLAVAVATALDHFTPAERLLLSWAGLRGGVAVVLATLPVIAGISGATKFFNVVFVIVVLTTLVQGMTIEPVARRLGLLLDDRRSAAAAAAPALEQVPWQPELGNPAHPVAVDGLAVVEHLRVRADAAGALVTLADGRHALTGPTLTVGPADALGRYATQRLAAAGDDAERAWWRGVALALRGGARARGA